MKQTGSVMALPSELDFESFERVSWVNLYWRILNIPHKDWYAIKQRNETKPSQAIIIILLLVWLDLNKTALEVNHFC